MQELRTRTLKSDALLLTAAIIWGFAFVAQRAGMEYIGPFLFNGIRFALGSLALIPLLLVRNTQGKILSKSILLPGIIAGTAIFMGVSFQQVGIVYTTAGKAGFITGLYVIIVPIFGLFLGKKTGMGVWAGAILAGTGLYFLSVKTGFSMEKGDLLVLIGAMFWAIHVHIIGHFAPKIDTIKLAFLQFATVSILSMTTALVFEKIRLQNILSAWIPIIYAGVFSAGIAYTLQVVAQKDAHPSHAAIILSLESVFAVFGGWIILGERLSTRELVGCGMMLAGMILSQLYLSSRRKEAISIEKER